MSYFATEWVGFSGEKALYANSWQYTQGVKTAAFVYGANRYTVGLPAAPASGVRVRVGNPSQDDIAVAASSFGYLPTDRVVTIWSNTLRADPLDALSERIAPLPNDKLQIEDESGRLHEYVIKSVKEAHWDTQYVCYCSIGSDENLGATPESAS